MNLLELIPETEFCSIERLKEKARAREILSFAERIGYTNRDAGLAEVGSDVTLEALERLEDIEGNPNLVRDGKERLDDIHYWAFSTEKERQDFFEAFGKGVESLEKIMPLARKYREGVLKNIKRVNENLRALLRSINFEEETISRKTQEHLRFESLLNAPEFRENIYKNMILPACENNPVVFLYLASNPSEQEHAFQVAMWADAIESRAGIQDKSSLEESTVAALLHDVGDFYVEQKKLGQESEVYKIRDFLVPQKLFIIRTHGAPKFLDGITAREIELIAHHHSRRDGRPAKIGQRMLVYLPEDLNILKEKDKTLRSKITNWLDIEDRGIISLEFIKTPLYGALYLAERFVTSMEKNNSPLNAAAEYKQVGREKGLCARSDYVDAFLGLVEEKYFKKNPNSP